MSKLFLVTNPGSSSRKYALYRDDALVCSLHFEFEGKDVVCTLKTPDGTKHKLTGFKKLTDTVEYVQRILTDQGYFSAQSELSAILARVVAAGEYFTADHLVDDECLRQLEIAKARTPLHVPVVAAEISACLKVFQGTPVIIISDSAFHATRDAVHTNYAIDQDLARRAEIKRYGFHGLSVGSIAHYLDQHQLAADKVIVCHLGSGSSVTALKSGQSFDTTMGYTPLEGLMMATRCGDIDPAAALAIGRELKLQGDDLEAYLNKQCGFLGVTGTTDDLREVISLRDDGDPKAKLAYDLFIYRVQRAIGQMAASLNGADALVFTATIGERNAAIRRDIISGLSYLNFKVNDTKNADGLGDQSHCLISGRTSNPIYVILTDETGEMIRRARTLLDR